MVQVMLPGWEVVTGTHVEVNECLDTENIPVCLQNGHQMWLSCCLGTLSLPSRGTIPSLPTNLGEKGLCKLQTTGTELKEHHCEREQSSAPSCESPARLGLPGSEE